MSATWGQHTELSQVREANTASVAECQLVRVNMKTEDHR